jgi:hypothetical protein
MADDRQQALRTVYQELCKTHNGIADFRAKLLALLPIASGTGVFLFLGKLNGSDRKLLIAVGLFGLAVTFGLFMYELRGIEDCTALRGRGEDIEETLGIEEWMSQFRNWQRGKGNLADEIGAAWIVYMTVLATWVFVGLVGLSSLSKGGWPSWLKIVAGLGLGIVYLVVLVAALRGWRGRWGHDYWGARRGEKRD